MNEIILKIKTRYPYKTSLQEVHKLAGLWQMVVVKSSTKSPFVTIRTTDKVFKQMMAAEPKNGVVILPEILQSFIAEMIVEIKNVKEHTQEKRKTMDRRRR